MTGDEKGEERRFVYVCVWTLGSDPSFNLWRCEVNGNLFCMSAADSCRGPFGSLGHVTSFIGQTWQGGVK